MFATRLLIAALALAGTEAVSLQEVAQHGEINLAQIDTTRRGRHGIDTGSASRSGGLANGGEGLAQID